MIYRGCALAALLLVAGCTYYPHVPLLQEEARTEAAPAPARQRTAMPPPAMRAEEPKAALTASVPLVGPRETAGSGARPRAGADASSVRVPLEDLDPHERAISEFIKNGICRGC